MVAEMGGYQRGDVIAVDGNSNPIAGVMFFQTGLLKFDQVIDPTGFADAIAYIAAHY
jgi:hypothetical protein